MLDQPTNEPKDRADLLRDAPMATLLMQPVSPEAIELETILLAQIDELEEEKGRRKRARRESVTETLRSTISAMVADMVTHSAWEPSGGFCYHNTENEDFKDSLATLRHYKALLGHWEELGLIEVVKGFQPVSDFDGPMKTRGWATRFRALQPLLDVALDLGIAPDTVRDHYSQRAELVLPIVLRAKKVGKAKKTAGKRMKLNRADPKVQELAAQMNEVNDFLGRFTFNFPEPPLLRRIFNNGDQKRYKWDQGGRLQASGPDNYQSMSPKDRLGITINGHSVVELDFKASQLTIAYGLAGLTPPPGDLYQIDGLPREVVKSLVTAYLGKGGRPSKWPEGVGADYQAKYGRPIQRDIKLGEAVGLVLQKHPVLDELERRRLTVHTLQFIESEIILSAILKLIRDYGAPSLPVFDCLIVRARDEEYALQTMQEAFYDHVGLYPGLSRKQA